MLDSLRSEMRQLPTDTYWPESLANLKDWTRPQFSRKAVDQAGSVLIDKNSPDEAYMWALQVINNWRSSHGFPLNTLQVGLRTYAGYVDQQNLVAQRIKRLWSIEHKLRRSKNWQRGPLTLSEMQDIGGCRAIVSSVARAKALAVNYKASSVKHKLDDEDDYIQSPKKSGYRGIHLIYRYHSDKNDHYNGLKIEMQIRSRLQHAFATAVEAVDAFTGQMLKASQGNLEWRRFFSLMGSALALRERTPLVPDTPQIEKELKGELRQHAQSLDVPRRLEAYRAALNVMDVSGKKPHFFLVVLDMDANQVRVSSYQKTELPRAASEYLATENELTKTPGVDAVLVSVDSVSALKRAYPNYFLDTRLFLEALKRAIS